MHIVKDLKVSVVFKEIDKYKKGLQALRALLVN